MEQTTTQAKYAKELPARMKAIPFTAVCKPEQLVITDWDTPKITADDEVIIEVRSFGLNFADISARKGQYNAAPPFPYVPGYEVSGIAVAIGAKVTTVKLGDKVIAGTFNFGGYAQYAKTIEAGVMQLPSGWSFAQGASVLVNYGTAYHALYASGWILPGDKVLIHAAAGGVGLALIQLCKLEKCEIFGTCGSDEKIKLLREKGVEHPINYRTSDFEVEVKKLTNNKGVDIIFDSVGGHYFKKDLKVLQANGRLIGFGASALSDRSIGRAFSIIGDVVSMSTISSIDLMLTSKSFVGVNIKEIADKKPLALERTLQALVKLFNDGTLKTEILTELPWTEISKAHQLLEGRQSTGKFVLTIPEEK